MNDLLDLPPIEAAALALPAPAPVQQAVAPDCLPELF